MRRIWGKSDTILFIFAGAAAEFALNKAVDWLYFTGRLPSDPLGRLFSTVSYARVIVFAPRQEAEKAIATMRTIHSNVEKNRGATIPDWAYRDVLFMLIHYSIASFELLERRLTPEEKEEVFNVFYRVGVGMGLTGLPTNYIEWQKARAEHLESDLANSHYTADLFKQYRKHLGAFRYWLLREAQLLVVPTRVKDLLERRSTSLIRPIVPLYRWSRSIGLHRLVQHLLLPPLYRDRIKALDVAKE